MHCIDDRITIQEPITPMDHRARQDRWSFPDKYRTMDCMDFFLSKCKRDDEKTRVLMELEMFKERNLMNLLRWAIWFMDFVKDNNIFIGVGRGSSVSSYCLFLIEMHLVDSLKFNLDPKDFLKG